MIPNSERAEFEYLMYRYNFTIGIEDSNKLKEKMLKIAQELNDNEMLSRVYRLNLHDSKSVYREKIRKRKSSCYDIDLTYYYNKPGGEQGGVGYCYGFSTAGLLNNALGIDNMNPLYLHILNISNRSSDFSVEDEGGRNEVTSDLALSLKTYCSTSELLNPWKSNISTTKCHC